MLTGVTDSHALALRQADAWETLTASPRPGLSSILAAAYPQSPFALEPMESSTQVLAVDYCHHLGIAHRDIKLENAMLDRPGPRAILKLCDFGYASRNQAHPEGAVPCRRVVGTPEYMVRPARAMLTVAGVASCPALRCAGDRTTPCIQ